MKKSVKISGMSLKGLIAGGLLAGAVGLGYGAGDYGSKEEGGQQGAATEQQEGTGVGGGTGPGMAQTDLPPNVAPGWKIRVCSEKTKAQQINFRVSPGKQQKGTAQGASGTGEGGAAGQEQAQAQAQGEEMASWSKGDPTLINLPETFNSNQELRIETIPAQENMQSEVCVLYNDHVTKKISFDGRKETTVKMDQSGSCSC
jgi:hypothetical protein